MVNLFGVKLLDQSNFSALHEQLAGMNPGHFAHLKNRYKNLTAMQHRLLGELLVKAVAVGRFELPANETAIAYGDNSKPYFQQHPELQFNLSHSGAWVVAAFSDKPVGIDIEKIKHVNLDIARRFFAADEITYLQGLPDSERMEGFFSLWTLKESYLKALGTGLTRSLNSFMVTYDGSKISLSEEGIRVDVFLNHFELDKDYKLAVCALEKIPDKTIDIFTYSGLLDFYKIQ